MLASIDCAPQPRATPGVMSNIWSLYNLAGNPFFQHPLGEDPWYHTQSTQELFVGREADVELALKTLTHDTATRAVINGAPGVGKRTFLNRIKAELDKVSRSDAPSAPR